ncbi:MAG: cobalamin-dependent protein [Bacteroidales bacterium]|jgi:methanogenic corrinoid protein MtbC1|nr:cobalamin-dependent protein [Bacteroidales bacterium]
MEECALIKDFKYKDFLLALLDGNRKQSFQIVEHYLERGITVKELYEEYIKKTLYRVGELWEHNKISVASEHLATAITESILNSLFEKIVSEKRVGKSAIVACVENEYHQVGIKMIADVFEMNGWDTHFLGANVPVDELVAFAKAKDASIFALSLSIYFHLPVLEKMLEKITEAFPETSVIVGGQAFRHGGLEVVQKYPTVKYFKNLEDTESFIKKIS